MVTLTPEFRSIGRIQGSLSNSIAVIGHTNPSGFSGIPSEFDLLFSQQLASSLAHPQADQPVSPDHPGEKASAIDRPLLKPRQSDNPPVPGQNIFEPVVQFEQVVQLPARLPTGTTAGITLLSSGIQTSDQHPLWAAQGQSVLTAQTLTFNPRKGLTASDSTTQDSGSLKATLPLAGDRAGATTLPDTAQTAIPVESSSAIKSAARPQSNTLSMAAATLGSLNIDTLSCSVGADDATHDAESMVSNAAFGVNLKNSPTVTAPVQFVIAKDIEPHTHSSTGHCSQAEVNSSVASSGNTVVISPFKLTADNTMQPVAEQLAAAVSKQIDEGTSAGSISMRIRIEGSEHGTVTLNLSVNHDAVSVRIMVQDEVTRHLIHSQLNDLRQSLNNRGITCGECEVTCNSSDRNSSDSRQSTSAILPQVFGSTSRWTRAPQLSSPSILARGGLNVVA